MCPALLFRGLSNGCGPRHRLVSAKYASKQLHPSVRPVVRSTTKLHVLKPARNIAVNAPPAKPLRTGESSSVGTVVSSLLKHPHLATGVLTTAGGLGILLGILTPSDPFLPTPLSQLSSCMGWLYFLSWSISFYPQLLENWKRKSVEGFSADYIIYHAAGYVAYFLYTYFLLFNNDIRGAYALENAGGLPEIQISDVLFAAHGFCIMLATFWQYSLYSRDGKTMSNTCKGFVVGLTGLSVVYWQLLHSGLAVDDPIAALHFLYFLGNVKLLLTFLSYLPQAVLNAQRRSTEGFSMGQVLLDVGGGGLSMLQVLLHCTVTGSWGDITSSPAKFLLGWCSILFDVLFLAQHYVLYSDSEAAGKPRQLQLQLARTTSGSKTRQ